MELAVVISARNEEKNMAETIRSIQSQTLPPSIVIVVDDGSTDKTGDIARDMDCLVVEMPFHKESYLGRPELAGLFNAGLRMVPENCEYVMISGADVTYSKHYIEKIVSRMEKEGIVVASGIVLGDATREFGVRGTGRVVKTRWWRKYRLSYPELYGWESWLIFRALMDGVGVKVYDELVMESRARKTSLSKEKAYFLGKGMKALGYWWPYALGRCILLLSHPTTVYAMLKGYFSNVAKHEDIEDFVRAFQKKRLLSRIGEVLARKLRLSQSPYMGLLLDT